MTGVVGRIRWAYYDAAQLEGYTVTRAGTDWRVSGRVVLSDAFKLAQRPLVFVAPTQHGDLQWPIRTLSITNGQLMADLGPPLP